MSQIVSNSAPPADITPIVDATLSFLWRQWAQLGVSGEVIRRDAWLIDPEVLLLFTMRVGRFDPRLFDEVLDWCAINGDWLSLQRVKALLKKKPESKDKKAFPLLPSSSDILAPVVAAFAETMMAGARSHRWRTLLGVEASRDVVSKASGPIPFFREGNGQPLPLFGREDANFLAFGFVRAPVELRGLSMEPPMNRSACLMLRLRSLFGVDPRAEAVAYLLSHRSAGSREIARATGYAPATMHAVLAKLAQGQFLIGSGQQGYSIGGDKWRAFLDDGVAPFPPIWVDWLRVLPALATAVEILAEGGSPLSGYLRASLWLRLDTMLRDSLIGSGLPNPFATPCNLEDVGERLPERLQSLAWQLNEGMESGML